MASNPLQAVPTQQPVVAHALAHDTDRPVEGIHHDDDVQEKRASSSVGASRLPLPQDATATGAHHGSEEKEFQAAGVGRIQSFYAVFSKPWLIWSFWLSFTLWGFASALSSNTTFIYLSFATSNYTSNNLLATIAVVASIASAVSQPFWAKWADLWSRQWALIAALSLYVLGYIMTAASNNVETVAAGQTIYTVGSAGLTFMQSLIIGDLTSLKYRGLVNGAITLPYILFAFVAPEIYNSIGSSNWRWGYGMFCVVMPACLAPIVVFIIWADGKAKKIGLLSVSASSMRYQLALASTQEVPSHWQRARTAASVTDAFGILLLGFCFALLLSPPTLVATATGGFANPSMIAMMAVGGVLFVLFVLWEWKGASHPIMPLRVLNKTFLLCLACNFFYFMSAYLNDTYWATWVYVVSDFNDRQYAYLLQVETVALCLFGTIGGLIQLVWGRYKWLLVGSQVVRVIGGGITYWQAASGNVNAVTLVFGKLLLYSGGGVAAVATIVASQASVKHKDLALVIALLSLWTSVGGAVGQAAVGAIWSRELPIYLAQNIPTLTAEEIYNASYDQDVARLTEPRAEVIAAFNSSYRDCSLPALIIMMTPLVLSFFFADYKLDNRHNAVETEVVAATTPEKDSERQQGDQKIVL